MTFSEPFTLTRNIAVELNESNNQFEVTVLAPSSFTMSELGLDSTLYSGVVVGRILNNLEAIVSLPSLIESLPPEVEDLSELERATALRNWKSNSQRKQLDFYENNLFRGTLTLVRIDPYSNQPITDVVWSLRENFSPTTNLKVKQVNAGHGLLVGEDKVNFFGSYLDIVQVTKKAVWLTTTTASPSPSPTPTPTPTPPPDTTPPTAVLSTPTNITTENSNPYQFIVTYSDDIALNTTSIGNTNIRVYGTNNYNQLATVTASSISSDSKSAVVTYQVTAPGTWDSTDNGTFTINLLANQIRDTSNNYAVAGQLGSFTVNVPVPTPTPTPTPTPETEKNIVVDSTPISVVNGVGSFTVKLNQQPPDDLSLDVNTTDSNNIYKDYVVFTPEQFSFNSSNWNTPQTCNIQVSQNSENPTTLNARFTTGSFTPEWDLLVFNRQINFSGTTPTPTPNPAWLSSTGWVASSNFNNAGAANAIDSNLSTFWTSNAGQTTSMYWQLDLSTTRTISKVDISEPSGDVGNGFLQVSLDGTNWTNIKTGIPFNTLQEFAAVSARYIRLQNNQNAGAYWRLTEIGVYGY